MSIGIIGRKIGMTQRFDENGNVIPLTVIQAGPCKVVQKKTAAKDQYNALQLGFEPMAEKKAGKKLSKAIQGHYKKHESQAHFFLREIRLKESEVETWNEGDEITVDQFEGCEFVDVVGTSKGRGYAGVIKRHNFSRPKMTHGTHEKFRHGGSLGCRFPQRVVKGKKMAGHYGNETITKQNLKIDSIRKEDNLILIHGPIPGANNSIVMIKEALKKPMAKS